MIALLDTSEDLKVAGEEVGCAVGQLLTPLTRFHLQYSDLPFGIDNGAFAGFDVMAFKSLLAREFGKREQCLFVAVPDVVGSARRTLEVFEAWRYKMNGWPLALVCQDGQEDLPIPWDGIEAIFIGGSTGWKMSRHSEACIKAAKALGKWVHVGRVNTPGRYEHFEKMGADSIDGTGLSRFSHMRAAIHEKLTRPKLFTEPIQ